MQTKNTQNFNKLKKKKSVQVVIFQTEVSFIFADCQFGSSILFFFFSCMYISIYFWNKVLAHGIEKLTQHFGRKTLKLMLWQNKQIDQNGVKSIRNAVLKRFNYLTISEQSVEVQIGKIHEI